MSPIVTQGQSRKQTDLIAFLCPRQELNLRPAGLQPAALTKLSYRGFILRAAATSKTRRDAHSSDGGTRTRDTGIMRPMLCQLSYARIHTANSARTLSHTLRDAASIIFCPVGRTRTYGLRLIRSALSPSELRRKRRKQNRPERPTPRENYMPLRRRRQTDIASDRKEETKPTTLVR